LLNRVNMHDERPRFARQSAAARTPAFSLREPGDRGLLAQALSVAHCGVVPLFPGARQPRRQMRTRRLTQSDEKSGNRLPS
jgi:hypothetical protein